MTVWLVKLFIVMLSFTSGAFGKNNFHNPYLQGYPSMSYVYEACEEIGGLQSIKTKKNHFLKQSDDFTYYYRQLAGIKPQTAQHNVNQEQSSLSKSKPIDANMSQTTIVYLPGGPGQGSILESEYSELIPKKYQQIYIDPRGTGCNFFGRGDFELATINSVQTAIDILEVIKAAKLTNYIVYGQSYGTLLGTILVDLIEQDSSMQPPKALLLEGTLTTHYLQASKYSHDHVDIVNQLLRLNPKIQKLFMDPSHTFLGKSNNLWASYLMSVPRYGTNQDTHFVIQTPWQMLSRVADVLDSGLALSEEDLEFFENAMNSEDNFVSPIDPKDDLESYMDLREGFLKRAIICQEIALEIPWLYYGFGMQNGLVTLDNKPAIANSCAPYVMNNPFDAKNFPFVTPTVYIQGTLDAPTPWEQARHHYEQSLSVKKVFISVVDGGHSPSYFELAGCFEDMFNVIDKDPNLNFGRILDSKGHCLKHRPSLNRRPPQEQGL